MPARASVWAVEHRAAGSSSGPWSWPCPQPRGHLNTKDGVERGAGRNGQGRGREASIANFTHFSFLTSDGHRIRGKARDVR